MTPTPEPASFLLFGLGLLGTGVFGRRKLGKG
ncbi:MAG: PEP-CTERM sorting domain-containing protein [Acidobacteriota bacterium]|nr:PEP-CTERM sorting domain-containing protein [Acidobacteriota bacterium]